MSNNLPENNKTEEIDLGQLFSYLEKLFKKIGDLLSRLLKLLIWVLNKMIIFLFFSFNVFIRNIAIVVIAGIIGYAIVYFIDKTEEELYYSNMLIKQNFSTGKVLYTNIGNLNSLAGDGDSLALSRLLNIKPEIASQIKGFKVFHSVNRNDLIEDYYNFMKLDSTLTLSLDEYLLQEDLELSPIQTITVFSKSPDIYNNLASGILSSITNNDYFNEIKTKDSIYLSDKIQALKMNIMESDSMKNKYIDLLSKYYGQNIEDDSKSSTINLSLSNSKDRINTKEYALLEKQNQYRAALLELKNELRNKTKIVDLLKDFSPASVKENEYGSRAKWLAILMVLITLMILILKELGFKKLIQEYGSKDKLLSK